MALDDSLAELALGRHVVRASLVADERQAHRLQVPALAPEERLKRLRLDAVERRRGGAHGERERALVGVGHTSHRRRGLAGGEVAHGGQARRPGGEQVAEDPALGRHAADVDRRFGDDPQPTLAAQHHLAHARAG